MTFFGELAHQKAKTRTLSTDRRKKTEMYKEGEKFLAITMCQDKRDKDNPTQCSKRAIFHV